jgi:hypothetical protein
MEVFIAEGRKLEYTFLKVADENLELKHHMDQYSYYNNVKVVEAPFEQENYSLW